MIYLLNCQGLLDGCNNSPYGGNKRDKKMIKLQNITPYDLSMSKNQFSALWVRNHHLLIHRVGGSRSIAQQKFKAKFSEARGIKTNEAFIQAILAECNKKNCIMVDYINTHYERVVLGG